jgi:hypothetical protein
MNNFFFSDTLVLITLIAVNLASQNIKEVNFETEFGCSQANFGRPGLVRILFRNTKKFITS